MIRSISKGAVAATLLGMGFTTSGLAQSPYRAILPIEDAVKKPTDATPDSGLAQSPYRAILPIEDAVKKPTDATPDSGLAQSPYRAILPIEDAVKKPTDATPEAAPSISQPEVLPFPKAEDAASYAGPAIIPPGNFLKIPVATARVETEQEPDSSASPSAPAAPKAQVVIEPVQTKLVTPVVTGKTERPSLWKRLFGKREVASSCQTNCIPCDPKPVDRVAPAVPSVAATPKSGSIDSANDSTPGRADLDAIPGRATVNDPAGRATVDGIRGRATVDLSAAPDRIQLANLPRNQDPVSIANGDSSAQQRAEDPEAFRLQRIKELLKQDMLPSHRMAAAEELLQCVPGRIGEVRAALLKSAQEDPAACVRAACIHALSKLNTRGEDFSTLLDTSLEDESAEVRDEANYALAKLKRK